jgi:tetratricopeptide (TPR) repeat protein
MIFLKLFIGILFFFLGWIYLYRSNLVLSLNRLARDIFFNDRRILLERKKLSILFFCFSFIALYMGFSSFSKELASRGKNHWTLESDNYLMYLAMQDYCTERYESALGKYAEILKHKPDDPDVLKRIAYTYTAMGEKKKARAIWQKLLRLVPTDEDISRKLSQER